MEILFHKVHVHSNVIKIAIYLIYIISLIINRNFHSLHLKKKFGLYRIANFAELTFHAHHLNKIKINKFHRNFFFFFFFFQNPHSAPHRYNYKLSELVHIYFKYIHLYIYTCHKYCLNFFNINFTFDVLLYKKYRV